MLRAKMGRIVVVIVHCIPVVYIAAWVQIYIFA